MNSGIKPPPVLEAVEQAPPPPDGMSPVRAACALHLLQSWTAPLLAWQRLMPDRITRGSGRGPEWWAGQLREIAGGILRAADLIEGIERRDA